MQDTQVCGLTEPVGGNGEANVPSNQTVHRFYLHSPLYKMIRGVIKLVTLYVGRRERESFNFSPARPV